MENIPLNNPGTRCRLLDDRTATTRATGLRSRPHVMITSSPCWARETSSDSFVFASCMVARYAILTNIMLAKPPPRQGLREELGGDHFLLEALRRDQQQTAAHGDQHERVAP